MEMQSSEIPLSNREKEILQLVAQGKSNKEIASDLFISVNTVKVHLTKIFQKISVSSRTEASLYAISNGLYKPTRFTVDKQNMRTLTDASWDNANISESPRINLRSFLEKQMKAVWIVILTVFVIGIAIFLKLNNSPFTSGSEPLETPQQSRWQTLKPVVTPLTNPAVAVYENVIHVFGGNASDKITKNHLAYSILDNSWKVLADKPTPVMHAKAFALGGKLFIPGGQTFDGDFIPIVEVYDPKKNNWQSGAPLPEPRAGYLLSVSEGKVFIYGGSKDTKQKSVVLMSEANFDRWQEISIPDRPLDSVLQMIAINENLVFIGSDKSNLLRTKVYSLSWESSNGYSLRLIEDVKSSIKLLNPMAINQTDKIFLFNNGTIWITSLPEIKWYEFDHYEPNGLPQENSIIAFGDYIYFIGGKESSTESSSNFLRYQTSYTFTIPLIQK